MRRSGVEEPDADKYPSARSHHSSRAGDDDRKKYKSRRDDDSHDDQGPDGGEEGLLSLSTIKTMVYDYRYPLIGITVCLVVCLIVYYLWSTGTISLPFLPAPKPETPKKESNPASPAQTAGTTNQEPAQTPPPSTPPPQQKITYPLQPQGQQGQQGQQTQPPPPAHTQPPPPAHSQPPPAHHPAPQQQESPVVLGGLSSDVVPESIPETEESSESNFLIPQKSMDDMMIPK